MSGTHDELWLTFFFLADFSMSWECDSSLIWKHNTSNLKTSTSRCITKSVMWWPTWLGGIFVACKPWTLSSIVHWDDNSKIQQKPITYATVNYNNVAIWAEQGSDIITQYIIVPLAVNNSTFILSYHKIQSSRDFFHNRPHICYNTQKSLDQCNCVYGTYITRKKPCWDKDRIG